MWGDLCVSSLSIDSFHYLVNEDLNMSVNLSRNNIAWDTDREVRFRNGKNLAERLEGTNQPPNWPRNISGDHSWSLPCTYMDIN